MKFAVKNANLAIKKARRMTDESNVEYSAVVTDEGLIEICESDCIWKYGAGSKEAAILDTMKIVQDDKVIERMVTIPFGG